jgi:hypothetical protein
MIMKAAPLVLVLALTGCATTGGEPNEAATAATNAPATGEPIGTDPATPEEGVPDGPTAPPIRKVGDGFTWDDGVTVIVMKIENVTLEPQAAPRGGPAKAVEIQVQNKSGAVLSAPSSPYLTYGPAGQQAEQAYSAAYTGFQAAVPPGGTVTAKYAFVGVTDDSTMTVQFAPTYSHQPAFWTTP